MPDPWRVPENRELPPSPGGDPRDGRGLRDDRAMKGLDHRQAARFSRGRAWRPAGHPLRQRGLWRARGPAARHAALLIAQRTRWWSPQTPITRARDSRSTVSQEPGAPARGVGLWPGEVKVGGGCDSDRSASAGSPSGKRFPHRVSPTLASRPRLPRSPHGSRPVRHRVVSGNRPIIRCHGCRTSGAVCCCPARRLLSPALYSGREMDPSSGRFRLLADARRADCALSLQGPPRA